MGFTMIEGLIDSVIIIDHLNGIEGLELWTTAQTSNLRILWICNTFLNKTDEIFYFTSIEE